jgi:hypothetical protein
LVEVARLQFDADFGDPISLFGMVRSLGVRHYQNSALEQRFQMGLPAESSVFNPYKARKRHRLVSDQALISGTRLVTDQDRAAQQLGLPQRNVRAHFGAHLTAEMLLL